MIGTSKIRHWGIEDPVLKQLMKEKGVDEVPLFRMDSTKVEQADWIGIVEKWVGLAEKRDGPVNPVQKPIDDLAAATREIKDAAIEFGASDAGCAELTPIMLDLGLERNFKYIISLIIEEDYLKSLEGALAVETEAMAVYGRCAQTATKLAEHIRSLGYEAIADHNGTGEVQAIPAMYACGLGELGKHGSLIHPEFGARFRPGFVMTNMPLQVDSPVNLGIQGYCVNCKLCSSNCPPAAIPDSDDYVVAEGHKRWLTDISKCYECSRMRDEYCHICVDVCPFNHKLNGNPANKKIYKKYMARRKQAGFRTPTWFIEDEERVLGKES